MFVIDCVAFPGLKSEISTPRTKTRPRGPRYASFLTPRIEKNWLPAQATPLVLTGPKDLPLKVQMSKHI